MQSAPQIPPLPQVGDDVSVCDADNSIYLGQITSQPAANGFDVSATLSDGNSMVWQLIPYIGPAMLGPSVGPYITAQGITRPRR